MADTKKQTKRCPDVTCNVQKLVVAGQTIFYKNEHVFVGSKKDIYVVCFLLHFLSLNGNCQDQDSKHWEKKHFINIF